MMKLTFELTDRVETDLQQLNAMLAALKLESLELEDADNDLATARNTEGEIIRQRFGLGRCILNCEVAEDEEGCQYQFDTLAASAETPHQALVNRWHEEQPDRVVRIVQVTGYETVQGC